MDRKQMNFGNWKGSADKEANYFMPFYKLFIPSNTF